MCISTSSSSLGQQTPPSLFIRDEVYFLYIHINIYWYFPITTSVGLFLEFRYSSLPTGASGQSCSYGGEGDSNLGTVKLSKKQGPVKYPERLPARVPPPPPQPLEASQGTPAQSRTGWGGDIFSRGAPSTPAERPAAVEASVKRRIDWPCYLPMLTY